MYTFLDWYYNLVECCLSMIYFYCYHPYTGTERGCATMNLFSSFLPTDIIAYAIDTFKYAQSGSELIAVCICYNDCFK